MTIWFNSGTSSGALPVILEHVCVCVCVCVSNGRYTRTRTNRDEQ